MDLKGAKDRLGFDAKRAAMEIEDEFDENRWESQEALKYGGRLFKSFHELGGFYMALRKTDFRQEACIQCSLDTFLLHIG